MGRPDSISRDMVEAVSASLRGRIATLIVPNDFQSADVSGLPMRPAGPIFSAVNGDSIEKAARALRNGRRNALIIGGRGLREYGLLAAARVKAATGCDLLSDGFPAYIERGAGLPYVERIPYFPEAAHGLLSRYEAVVLAGAHEPVTFFGYQGSPVRLLTERQDKVILCSDGEDAIAALQGLAEALGAPPVSAVGKGAFASFRRPPPTGTLTPEKACAVLAALQPEGAIVVDEGLTSAFAYADLSDGGTPTCLDVHQPGEPWIGMPCAVGAALAAPGRKVINLQADGSALYTVQALWTESREGLDITTLLCSNKTYHILEMEFSPGGYQHRGYGRRTLPQHLPSRCQLGGDRLGIRRPCRIGEYLETLADEIKRSLREEGPHLIEMRL